MEAKSQLEQSRNKTKQRALEVLDEIQKYKDKLEKDDLIKYLENKIKEYKDMCIGRLYLSRTRLECETQIKSYQDILERIRNNNYESK